jgi:hypothetical protein
MASSRIAPPSHGTVSASAGCSEPAAQAECHSLLDRSLAAGMSIRSWPRRPATWSRCGASLEARRRGLDANYLEPSRLGNRLRSRLRGRGGRETIIQDDIGAVPSTGNRKFPCSAGSGCLSS